MEAPRLAAKVENSPTPPTGMGAALLAVAPLTKLRMLKIKRRFERPIEHATIAEGIARRVLGWEANEAGEWQRPGGELTGYVTASAAAVAGQHLPEFKPTQIESHIALAEAAIILISQQPERMHIFPAYCSILANLIGVNLNDGRYTKLRTAKPRERAKAAYWLVSEV